MKKVTFTIGKRLLIFAASIMMLGSLNTNYAQDIRWLHVTDLQSPINEVGAEYENEFNSLLNTNYFSWPAQYGLDQNTVRMIGMWIGCKNFDDPVEGKLKSVKVIGSGPRNAADRVNEIFEQEIKLIAKRNHPQVIVDDQPATLNNTYDVVDSVDENMAADRMVLVKFNTSMGITVVKKVMVFDTPNDGNYFINDYTFTNTGIYNRNGTVKQQTLNDVYFYWVYRFAFSGESVGNSASTWGAFASSWGNSTINHDFGDHSSEPSYPNMRGFYSWYGPSKDRTNVSYEEDWGCPNEAEDGRMGSWKYAGSVTLHADKGSSDKSDDAKQPKTTWFIGSDINAMLANVSQYDEVFMSDRYTIMSEGHPDKPHDAYVGNDYAINYTDPRRQAGGGASQGQGYGPYTIAPGESVHIVFATGVSGLSRPKNLEVGANWIQYFKGSGTPTLVMPDGSQAPKTLDGANLYKRKWVETGKDSILKTFNNAVENYKAGYNIALPPPPPNQFIVSSGGDRISLSWSDNAASWPHFDGYVIYRSTGNITDPLTKYEKIFECEKSNVVHSYNDRTPQRGFDYYYYVQSKDDGTQNDVELGKPLYSSSAWTVTSQPATLQRPAIPNGPLPFDTTYWRLTAEKGPWTSSTNYFAYDAVTFNGSDYVCLKDTMASNTTPDIAGSIWKVSIYRGAWASGTKYNAGDFATYNGLNYFTHYSISGGEGMDLVRVVPNPYDIRSRLFQFGDKSQYDRIAFYGLPAVCKLKIFTERGDLIWEKDHTRGTGDELWDSTTSYGQIVSSGIYILYVEAPDGRKIIRKFVIIR